MDTKGGRFSMSINGQTYSGRGAAKIMSSGVSTKTGVNQDGTAYRTVEAKLVGIDVTFDRGIGLKWDSTMLLADVDLTFVETDIGLTRMYTSGGFDGDPTIDSATGEVSGVKVMTAEANYNDYTS